MWRSEPQIPLASIATIASSRAISSGSGFSSTRTSPGAWKVTALMLSPSCRVLGVFEEARARVAAEASGQPQLAKDGGGTVPLLTSLLVQGGEHHQHVVEPDLARPRQRPPGVVEAVDHARVDVGRRPDSLPERECALVDHLAEHPSEHETGGVG